MDNDSEFERIYRQLERQSEKIDHSSNEMRNLAESVSQLAQAVVAKEVNDQHMTKSHDELKTKVEKLAEKVSLLDKAYAGDETIRKIFWIGVSAVVTLLVTAVVGVVIIK
jgi:methyl-accepting chemotaxis protein